MGSIALAALADNAYGRYFAAVNLTFLVFRTMQILRSFAIVAVLLTLGLGTGAAQEVKTAAEGGPETLIVATRVAPPFSFHDINGRWVGLSIELWRDIAARMGLTYRFEEVDLTEMVEGTASGRFDAAVAALTVTDEREMLIDFSHPFFSTGLAIATRPQAGTTMAALSGLITWRAGLAVLGVVAALVLVGVLLWLAERRKNEEYFGGPSGEGISGGVWQSLAMFVTGEYADQAPRTLAGRVLSTVWIVSSVVVLAVFTGIVTSSLTVQQMEGRVRGVSDLPNMRVGTLPASTSEAWLTDARIISASFSDVEEGLQTLVEGRIDAFVYDAPILKYLSLTTFANQILVLPENFSPQDYAIALPQGSPLREMVNRELLAIKESNVWSQRVFQYLGDR